MGYTTVCDAVMRDLLTCKSKLADVRTFADNYEDVLREALLYDELMAILNSVGYGEVENYGGCEVDQDRDGHL